MSPWVITGEFFMGLLVLGFLLWPYVRASFGMELVDDRKSTRVDSGVSSFVQVISDLEYDLETGKLSRDDYERLREEIFGEADINVEDLEQRSTGESGDENDIERVIGKAREKLDF